MTSADTERLGIGSVEIAATILETLAKQGGRSPLKELAASTGMHRGKVHRYLISLSRTGLVTQSARNGEYEIGPLAINIGLVGLGRIDPVRMAGDLLPDLRDKVNETVVLAVWGEMGATVIALEESARPVTLNVRIGSILPLLNSATGQVFAAHLPESRIAPILKAERARARQSEGTGVSPNPKDFARTLTEVRKRRMSRIEGTLIPGLNALAAPVFDYRDDLSVVIGVVGPQQMLNVSWEGTPAKELSNTVDELSRRLGHIPQK